ncbi:Spo0E family sporulation regulatory protein-aspartic acid phosphatase [Halanaerocella petrolearia]
MESLRKKLKLKSKKTSLQSKEVYRLSRELDEKIVAYMSSETSDK